MINILILLSATLWIIGFHSITRDNMILSFVGNPFRKDPENSWLHWIGKPLTECPTCMSSIHGAAWWLISGGTWYLLPVFCIVLAGFVEIVTSLIWKE